MTRYLSGNLSPTYLLYLQHSANCFWSEHHEPVLLESGQRMISLAPCLVQENGQGMGSESMAQCGSYAVEVTVLCTLGMQCATIERYYVNINMDRINVSFTLL